MTDAFLATKLTLRTVFAVSRAKVWMFLQHLPPAFDCPQCNFVHFLQFYQVILICILHINLTLCYSLLSCALYLSLLDGRREVRRGSCKAKCTFELVRPLVWQRKIGCKDEVEFPIEQKQVTTLSSCFKLSSGPWGHY